MKHMKKLASLLLALVMVMGLATTAFAAPETGQIYVENPVLGQCYNVYQILKLESYHIEYDAEGEKTGGQYAYKATSAWEEWLKTQTKYISIDAQGYVTWVQGASAADFAKAALAHAKENNIAASADSITATEDTVGESGIHFGNLELGYYLVDSTMGTLCALDTTDPVATVKEKNVEPTNVKEVKEGDNYGGTNDAAIGDIVYFQSTITAQAGAQNYVLHDKMDRGLTFKSVTGVTLNGTTVATSNYEVKTSELDDDCTFHVVFTQAFCDTLKKDDKIVVTYTATVNENAEVGKNDGNGNSSWLKYGENSDLTTTPSETTTYTWDVDVFKYTEGEAGDDGKKAEVALSGARFTLSKKSEGTDPIALVAEPNNVYRVATADDTDTVTEITTDNTGKFTIKGLDSGTYYLTETYAPAGYNKLAAPITIVIDSNGQTKVDDTVVNEVKVLNQSGTELPSTGGMGTTLLYAVGGILVLAAVVLLVAKKRAGADK